MVLLNVALLWVSFGINLYQDYESMPVNEICTGISLSLGGVLNTFNNCNFYVNRQALTEIIHEVDEQVQAIYKTDDRREEWRTKLNKYYVLEGTIIFAALIMGLNIGLPPIFTPLITAELMYKTSTPFKKASFSPSWWLEYWYQLFVILFAGISYTLRETLLFDLYFQMATVYNRVSDDILNLCLREDLDMVQEERKLRNTLAVATQMDKLGIKTMNR